MMDAFSMETIVQRLLHRVIALYTKLIAKARDKNDAPVAVASLEHQTLALYLPLHMN
jgi:hypothetical protein